MSVSETVQEAALDILLEIARSAAVPGDVRVSACVAILDSPIVVDAVVAADE